MLNLRAVDMVLSVDVFAAFGGRSSLMAILDAFTLSLLPPIYAILELR